MRIINMIFFRFFSTEKEFADGEKPSHIKQVKIQCVSIPSVVIIAQS